MSRICKWALRLSTVALSLCLVSLGSSQSVSGTRQVTLATPSSESLGDNRGSQYAIIIGIASYRSLPKLGTPVKDATEIAKILSDSYGFKTQLLTDATRDQIFQALDDARHSLTANDSLLIYYAGHGFYDKLEDEAYWAPADAGQDTYARWITASDITGKARAIPARHVLVVSDSCYSGQIARAIELRDSAASGRGPFLARMLEGKSRDLMSSGGNEPVSDSDVAGFGNHSVFANALLLGLQKIAFREFAASELFDQYVKIQVSGRSQQVPNYTPIRNSGHEGGDFVFFRKGEGGVIPAAGREDLPPVAPVSHPEQDAIRDALSRYQESYASMDTDLLKKVWPSLSKSQIKELRAGFDGAKAVMVELRNPAITVSGDNATVLSDQWMKWTRAGHQQPPQVNPVEIRLKKDGDRGWLIDAVVGR